MLPAPTTYNGDKCTKTLSSTAQIDAGGAPGPGESTIVSDHVVLRELALSLGSLGSVDLAGSLGSVDLEVCSSWGTEDVASHIYRALAAAPRDAQN